MDLGVVLGSKLEPKSTNKLSKTVSKIRSDFEQILDGSWTEFGPIWEAKLEAKLGPSWGQVGLRLTQLGRKLGPMGQNFYENGSTCEPKQKYQST